MNEIVVTFSDESCCGWLHDELGYLPLLLESDSIETNAERKQAECFAR